MAFHSIHALSGAEVLRRFQRRMVYGYQPAASPARDAGFAAGYAL
ncbi:MAG TPA: hypothetical protein VGL91_15120 [Acidobacteriota bacterium]